MIYEGKMGNEVEFKVCDRKSGELVPQRDAYLTDPSHTKEAGLVQIEVHESREGTASLREFHHEAHQTYIRGEKIGEAQGTVLVPGSEYGEGPGKIDPEFPKKPGYHNIIGTDAFRQAMAMSGGHDYFDVHPTRLLDQYRVLFALDAPIMAFRSVNSVGLEGETGSNGYRVKLLRDEVFADPQLGAQLQPYPQTEAEVYARREAVFQNWLRLSGMDEQEFIDMGFTRDKTGFDIIRLKPRLGTLEYRTPDSSTLDVRLATLALVKGIFTRMIDQDIPVVEDTTPEYPVHEFSDVAIVLPKYANLKEMEHAAKEAGLQPATIAREVNGEEVTHESNMLYNWMNQAVQFARRGLPDEEQPYLNPLDEMLATRKNLADKMMDHLRGLGYTEGRVTPDQATQLNLWLAEQSREAVGRLEHLL